MVKRTLSFVSCLLALPGLATTALARPAGAPAEAPASSAPASPSAGGTTGAGQATATSAVEAREEEKFPVSAAVGLTYRLNHANFVATESEATTFGYQRGTLTADVGYAFTDAISAGVSLAIDKELSDSFHRPALGGGAAPGGPGSRVQRATEIRDVGLSVAWNGFYKIPVVDISMSASLGAQLPASKASRSAGVLFAVSPGLSLAWSLADFSATLGADYTHYVNDEATQQIDCESAPHVCQVAGRDLGVPLGLHEVQTSLTLGYKILDPLSVSATYLLGNTWGAVEFPEDEFTAPQAQTGIQTGTGYHLTQFGVSYKVLAKTKVSLSMTTVRTFYTADGKSVTVPLFDLDSDLHHRTYYQIGLSQSL